VFAHTRGAVSPVHVLAALDGYREAGPGRQLLALAKAQRTTPVTTSIAVFQRGPLPTPLVRAVDRGTDGGAIVLRERFRGDPRMIRHFASAAGAGVDVLQTHGYKPNVLASLLSLRTRMPWVAFLHGETWESTKVRAYAAIERIAVRRATRVAVMSKAMAARLERCGIPPARIRIVYNACLSTTAASSETAPGSERPLVAVIGRLSPEKGVDVALAVLARVRRSVPSAVLAIAGEGRERPALERLARELGVAPAVEWLGYREDVGKIYDHADVLLLPSWSEGMPNVCLEAMGNGVPIVATAVGGVPELVTDGWSGFLAPAGDVEGLAAATARLLRDPSLRRECGQRARADVRERFSLEARKRAVEALLAEVLE
jgi:glycosyltransferase involved in cell wall biosynthesis